MKGRKLFYALASLVLLGVGITIAGDGIQPTFKPTEKAFYLTAAQASFVRPGLKLEIQKVEFDPPNVLVTFRIADNAGQGLDRLGIETPGAVTVGVVLARIKPGDTQYSIYTFRPYNTSTRGDFFIPWTDTPEGTYTSLGDGVYKYTLTAKLPSDFEVNATHTVGVQAQRNLTEFDLGRPIANALLNFVPSGAPVTQVRDIVRTENCNQCHSQLVVHGARKETGYCILCHQPQNIDIYNTSIAADFKVIIHKIHMGANLPSVSGRKLDPLGPSGGESEGGVGNPAVPGPAEEDFKPVTPYRLACAPNAKAPLVPPCSDYSSVVWPQDVRNCTTCHQGASQADNYKNNPSRVACGSCHDDVDFSTGKNHAGGVQVDDSKCSICHPADGQEFDLSVTGAHTIPAFSKKIPGLNVKILQVTNTKPGNKPTVSFTVTDNAGNPVDVSKLDFFRFTLTGPTTDYTTRGNINQEDARSAQAGPSGYTYAFKTVSIPADAKGTFAIGAESYRQVTIKGPLAGQSFPLRDVAFNPVVYFDVGGGVAAERRKVVDRANCNSCHKHLAAHGGIRNNPDYCVACHNPAETDQPDASRTAGFNVPAGIAKTSINFRFMIHRIHSGEELSRDFTVYRSRGVFNFNGVRFPADRRDCAKCHVNKSNQLPLPEGLANTVAPREFYSPLGPTASACLGCHDGQDAAAHTYLMTAPFGESCAVCHEEGADFAVSKVHAH